MGWQPRRLEWTKNQETALSPLHLLCQKCTSIISALCGREGWKTQGEEGWLENMRSQGIKEVHLISFLFDTFFFGLGWGSVENSLADSEIFQVGGVGG